jgi:hypothetical protein
MNRWIGASGQVRSVLDNRGRDALGGERSGSIRVRACPRNDSRAARGVLTLHRAHASAPHRHAVHDARWHGDAAIRSARAPLTDDFGAVARTLRVAHSVEPGIVGGTGRGQLGPTKTGRMRRVDLTPRLVAALSGLQVEGEAEALAADAQPVAVDFSGDTSDGTRAHELQARRADDARGRAPRRAAAVHALRLSPYLCESAARGDAPPTYVAAQLGDSVATVLRFYARWIPGGDTRWTDRLAAIRGEAPAGARRKRSVGRPLAPMWHRFQKVPRQERRNCAE